MMKGKKLAVVLLVLVLTAQLCGCGAVKNFLGLPRAVGEEYEDLAQVEEIYGLQFPESEPGEEPMTLKKLLDEAGPTGTDDTPTSPTLYFYDPQVVAPYLPLNTAVREVTAEDDYACHVVYNIDVPDAEVSVYLTYSLTNHKLLSVIFRDFLQDTLVEFTPEGKTINRDALHGTVIYIPPEVWVEKTVIVILWVVLGYVVLRWLLRWRAERKGRKSGGSDSGQTTGKK